MYVIPYVVILHIHASITQNLIPWSSNFSFISELSSWESAGYPEAPPAKVTVNTKTLLPVLIIDVFTRDMLLYTESQCYNRGF